MGFYYFKGGIMIDPFEVDIRTDIDDAMDESEVEFDFIF